MIIDNFVFCTGKSKVTAAGISVCRACPQKLRNLFNEVVLGHTSPRSMDGGLCSFGFDRDPPSHSRDGPRRHSYLVLCLASVSTPTAFHSTHPEPL